MGNNMHRNSTLLLLITIICMAMMVGCGGGIQPGATRAAPSDTPTPTSIVVPIHTATPTLTPLPTPTPTKVTSPSRPTPTPTKVPSPSTSASLVGQTIVDTFGFTLMIDGEVNVESSGLVGDDANISEGIIFFEYSGANAILMWFEGNGSDIDSVLADVYVSLVESQPDLTFSLINEGSLVAESYSGKYLTFITNNPSGDTGGGVMGSWECSPGKVVSLTVTGSDAAVVQIRFKRLERGFTCGG